MLLLLATGPDKLIEQWCGGSFLPGGEGEGGACVYVCEEGWGLLVYALLPITHPRAGAGNLFRVRAR